VAWLFALGLFWLFTEMRWKYLLASGAMVAVVLLLAILSLTTSSGSSSRFTGESGGTSIKYRFGWWEMAGMMIEDHPFMGVGTGNFPITYSQYVPRVAQVPRNAFWTHNSILQTWAENGLLAFLVYVSIYVVAAGLMLSVIRRARDATLRNLAITMLAAVGGYFVFAGSSNILENENYWIVFALCSVVHRLHLESEVVRDAPSMPAPVT
jgi:O-antigen ligase